MKRIVLSCLLLFFTAVSYGQRLSDIPALLKEAENAADTSYCKLYGKIGQIYFFSGRFDSAKYYLEKSLAKSREIKFVYGEATCYGLLAGVDAEKQNTVEALKKLHKAIDLFETIGADYNIASLYISIAKIYGDNKDFAGAEEHTRRALSIFIKLNDSLGLITAYNGLGGTSYDMGRTDSAILYFTKAMAFEDGLLKSKSIKPGKLTNFQYFRGHTVTGLAECYLKNKLYDKAKQLLNQEIEELGQNNNPLIRLQTLTILGKCYIETGEHSLAISTLRQVLPMLASIPDATAARNTYQSLSEAFSLTRQYDSAYVYSLKYRELADSIFRADNFRSIDEIRAKYEADKKDLQITQLNKQKRSQRIITLLSVCMAIVAVCLFLFAIRSGRLQKKVFRQREELLIKEKKIEDVAIQKKIIELEQMALRAQMNPHFIFNSLNTVQHFVMKQDVEGVNKYLGTFAHLVRLTLDNSGKPLVTVDEEIKYLGIFLTLEKMKSNDHFDFKIHVAENVDRYSTYIPGMILQPFAENCIRHGMAYTEPGKGMISIDISKNEKLICLVEDNGIGRNRAKQLKTKDGENEQGFESKGMAITMNRIEAINKIYNTDISVTVEDISGSPDGEHGTKVRVEFPLDME